MQIRIYRLKGIDYGLFGCNAVCDCCDLSIVDCGVACENKGYFKRMETITTKQISELAPDNLNYNFKNKKI